MAYKYREEIVGKRFLSVSGFTKLKLGKITEWGWRAGVIRAASHKDNKHKDLQVILFTYYYYKQSVPCRIVGVTVMLKHNIEIISHQILATLVLWYK